MSWREASLILFSHVRLALGGVYSRHLPFTRTNPQKLLSIHVAMAFVSGSFLSHCSHWFVFFLFLISYFFNWINAELIKRIYFQLKTDLAKYFQKCFLLWFIVEPAASAQHKTLHNTNPVSIIQDAPSKQRTFHLFPLQKSEQKWAGIIIICKRFTRSRRAPLFVNHYAMCFFNDISA